MGAWIERHSSNRLVLIPIRTTHKAALPTVAKRLYPFSSPSDATKFPLLCYCLIDSEKMIFENTYPENTVNS